MCQLGKIRISTDDGVVVFDCPDAHPDVLNNDTTVSDQIHQVINCDLCMTFTVSNLNCDCFNKYHFVDSYPQIRKTVAICNHSNNGYVREALNKNQVVISNSMSNEDDLRVSKTSVYRPQAHVSLTNIMVVPLMVHENQDCVVVGLVICANKKGGFLDSDYGNNHPLFKSAATLLLTRYQTEKISELQQVYDTSNVMHKEEMRRARVMQETFTATMSHEIRTPLNAINGYNEIMMNMEDQIDNKIVGWLRKQRDATLQLTQLIANILDFSKLRADGIKLESKPFSVHDCVNRMYEICSQDFARKKLRFNCSIKDSVPKLLVGDETRLNQVLLNLITNSVKHTDNGLIEVRVERMNRDEEDHKVTLLFTVEDTGSGIPMHLQKTIFEEFNQIRDDAKSSASIQGIGLGLAISKELVTLMGGKIWVESDGTVGSKVHFTARMHDKDVVSEMINTTKRAVKGGAALVVDDKEVNRIVFSKMLLDWNFQPHSCSSVTEAMNLLKNSKDDYFKLALIDIDLGPHETGVSLATWISNSKGYSDLIIIAASSMGSTFLGCDAFDAIHTKPIREEDLLNDISRLLENPAMRDRRRGSITQKLYEAPRERKGKEVTTTGRGIMVVDDDDSSLYMTKEMLTQIGYSNCTVAKDGYDALGLLQDNPDKYQCIFMDVLMPRISGIECTRRIISDPEKYGTPIIIALTADATERSRSEMVSVGAKGFLSKPVHMSELKDILTKFFGSSSSSSKRKKKKKKKK